MRRTAIVVASLLAAAALQPVTAGQALAPAERAARISLSAPSTVAPHSTITLRGRTKARRGAKVKIYQRPTHRSTWNLEGTTRVKKRGKFRYSEGVTDFSRYYRACVRRSCSAARLVTVSKPSQTAPQPATLTLTGGPVAQIEAGQSITTSGIASNNLIGKSVVLQAYDATSATWGAIGGAVVDGGANWSVTGPIGTAGKIGVRVVAPPTATTREAAVGAGIIAVYGWYYFYDEGQPTAVSDYDVEYRSANINGVAYPRSITDDSDTGSAEWNISRSCTKFAATVGVTDESNVNDRFSASIYSDSVKKWTLGNIGLGQAHPIEVDITNGLRLKLEWTMTYSAAGVASDIGFGDARALCSF